MKIGLISYPMLFQTLGGLQIQVKETQSALLRRGIEATIFDPARRHITEFDLLHVFSAINANYRIVEHAVSFNVPAVVSPLIQPHWNARLSRKAGYMERLVGRVTRWHVHTEYREIGTCLGLAQHLVALGVAEKQALLDAFEIPSDKISIVPNGIPDRFFHPDGNLFCRRRGLPPGYVLNVSTIDPYKNQLGLAKATAGTGLELVLIGPCLEIFRDYLTELQTFPHVRHIGPLDYEDPELPSAYASASVFCLPSSSEVMPLSVLEALAAGTPVAMTKHHCMDLLANSRCLRFFDPQDTDETREALLALRADGQRPECVGAVRDYTWDRVAESLGTIYRRVLTDYRAPKARGIASGLVAP